MDIVSILISQYLASLEMLRQTIVACPEDMWNAPDDRNKFWQTAFHALYFTHEYLWENTPGDFVFWEKHRPGIEDFDPSHEVAPYDKEAILEYLAFYQREVVDKVPKMDLAAMEKSGDRSYTMLELQIYTIRHIMQHTGELLERLSGRTAKEIDWVGRVRSW